MIANCAHPLIVMTEWRIRRHGPGMRQEQVHLKVAGPADLLAVVPFWLGYEPSDCIVVLATRKGRVQVGCAMPREQCFESDGLPAVRKMLGSCRSGTDYLIVGYGSPVPTEAALLKVACVLDNRKLVEVILVEHDRYWVLTEGDRPTSDAGRLLDPMASSVTAAAIAAGLQAHGSRQELAANVQGPDEDDDEARFLWNEARDNVATWSLERRFRFVDDCLHEAVDELHQPDALRCVELAVVVQQIKLRDHAWMAMDLDTGWRHQQLWLWVVAVTPPEVAAPVLCLAAMASWLSGGGALLTECIKRCEQLHPDYSMLALVRETYERALPPEIWNKIGSAHTQGQRRCHRDLSECG